MIKWRLLITTLPFVFLALAIKCALRFGFGFEGVVEFSDIGVVLTSAVFLIGFMLAGTMADYKESEKLPGDLACALDALEDNLMQACIVKPELGEARAHQITRDLSMTVRAWLYHKRPETEVFDSLEKARALAFDVERAGASSHASRALGEIQNLRKTITRIGVISRTNFIASGYALLDTLVVLSLSLVLVSKYKSTVGELIIVPFVTLIFVYMVRLIRDVDEPFGYGPNGERGAADVELLPLDDFDARRK